MFPDKLQDTDANMSKIALITASTRTPSVGPHIASWIHDILNTRPKDDLVIEPLAIADFNLPVYNEPVIPAMVPAPYQFTHEHSKKWSDAIASFAGYIFVIPEYNLGLSGATKNAIDYLYNEWQGKPVVVVSYGTQGGEKANKQLVQSLEGMKLRVVETRVLLPFAPSGDVMKAIEEGALGQDSKRLWEEAGKREVALKAWGELKGVVEERNNEKNNENKN